MSFEDTLHEVLAAALGWDKVTLVDPQHVDDDEGGWDDVVIYGEKDSDRVQHRWSGDMGSLLRHLPKAIEWRPPYTGPSRDFYGPEMPKVPPIPGVRDTWEWAPVELMFMRGDWSSVKDGGEAARAAHLAEAALGPRRPGDPA